VTTRLALVTSVSAFIAGVTTLAYLFTDPGPLSLCSLWPLRCISGQLSGAHYFMGDSQAAPVFHLMLAVAGPLLAASAALFQLRRRFVGALALAALACVPYSVFLLGTYAVMPFHPLVAGAVLVTFIAVSAGTTRAVWVRPA